MTLTFKVTMKDGQVYGYFNVDEFNYSKIAQIKNVYGNIHGFTVEQVETNHIAES